jgi:hypothetical protein
MQNRHSWENGSQPERQEVFRCEVASRFLIDAGSRIYARVHEVGKEQGLSRSLVKLAKLRRLSPRHDNPLLDGVMCGRVLLQTELENRELAKLLEA